MLNKIKWAKRVEPQLIADRANREFVHMAQMIMQVLSWRRPNNGDSHIGTARASTTDAVAQRPKSRKRRDPPVTPQSQPDEHDAIAMTDEILRLKLKELFHRDVWHRLAAVSWIRENRCIGAVSTLEGILAIEESEEAKNEIQRALEVLKTNPLNKKGERRCSKF